MSESDPARRNHRILWAVFLSALVAHAWFVTRNWTTPYMPGHEFRQSQTAITTYYIDQQDNFGLLYETPIVGKPWVSILMEVPVYEWSVVGLSRAFKIPHYVAARTVSLACFYLTLPALYLLLGQCGLARARRLLPLALVKLAITGVVLIAMLCLLLWPWRTRGVDLRQVAIVAIAVIANFADGCGHNAVSAQHAGLPG